MPEPRICILGLKCYDLLAGICPPRYIGGTESQLILLAPAIARAGSDASMIVYDHGQPDGQMCNGVRLLKAYDRSRGLPALRFIHPRCTGLWAAMTRADADVYYQVGAGCETGQAAWWCRRHGRRFVFGVASDGDCQASLPALPAMRERVLFRYGLRAADIRIAQTFRQQKMLFEQFNVQSQVMPAFCDSPADSPVERRPTGKRLLWVGRLAPIKRPQLLIDLAKLLPGYTIDVIGESNGGEPLADAFRTRAASVPAIRLRGKLSHDELADAYRSADLLVNTSATEGFPVTFLEAWSHGLPVATFFDPDGIVASCGLGVVAADLPNLAQQIRQLIDSPAAWQAAARAAARYYQSQHSVPAAVQNFLSIATAAMTLD